VLTKIKFARHSIPNSAEIRHVVREAKRKGEWTDKRTPNCSFISHTHILEGACKL